MHLRIISVSIGTLSSYEWRNKNRDSWILNSLEKDHSGIKNSLYQSVIKLSEIVKESNYKQKTICEKCGNECTGNVCSVCNMVLKLKENQT